MIKYNDRAGEWKHFRKKKVWLSPCATISDSTKTLSVTPEYGDLIANPEAILEYLEDEKKIRQFMLDKYGFQS